MNQSKRDRIDSYLRGEMSEHQRVEFEEDLKSDPELREDYELLKSIVDVLSDYHDKKSAIVQWDEEYHKRNTYSKKLFIRYKVLYPLLVCASVFLLIFTISYMDMKENSTTPFDVVTNSPLDSKNPEVTYKLKPTQYVDSLDLVPIDKMYDSLRISKESIDSLIRHSNE